MVTACIARYVPFRPLTGMQIARSNDRFRPSVVDFGRYHPREKKKRENKENLESGTALRLRDPFPTGDFFSPRGEKKRLLTWGE
ncbi:hypothetical protein B296_00004960 [Ensete ventricosum]|uniref:Uncharacterized protein n=1 Tax=Ensete ventricosum TaxID=4639 RepID=A0A427B6E0_ENSVE|nr:hypothetical protein B296_00004960 [Ensete ventricosum]